MAQYVYTMQGVTKIVPPQRTILQNINLSFYPGAKIGVLGLNGSGKSSLLRIMAGEDTEIDGEARAQKDIRVGYLPQEPGLDDDLDVRGNVELGVAPIMAILKEYNDISDRFAEPMDDDEMTKLLERQGDLATEIDAVEGWEIDRTLDIAADALRLPAWDTPVVSLSGGERRRVALLRELPNSVLEHASSRPAPEEGQRIVDAAGAEARAEEAQSCGPGCRISRIHM